MNREQLIERVRAVVGPELRKRHADYDIAARVVDAILPQVTTVEELEALPIGAIMVGTDDEGSTWAIHVRRDRYTFTNGRHEFSSARLVRDFAPLTVVHQP